LHHRGHPSAQTHRCGPYGNSDTSPDPFSDHIASPDLRCSDGDGSQVGQ
jgi:hypothetical protein